MIDRRVLWTAVILAICGVAVALLFAAPRHGGRMSVMGDAHYVYAAALSLAEDGDADIGDELDELGDPWGLGKDRASDGVQLPVRELGPSLLMVPGLWIAFALDLPPASWPVISTLPMALSWAFAFVGLFVAISADGKPERARLIALAATLGLPGAFYAVGYAGYAHGPDAAIGAWLTAALVRRARARTIGLIIAVGMLFRLQNALWLLWPACGIVAGEGRRDAIVRTASIAGFALLGTVPQAILAVLHPGSERGAIRWGLDFFDVTDFGRDVAEVLVGVHGLFTWTPLALLGALGLGLGLGRSRGGEVRISALVVIAAMVVLCALARDPAAGHAFGARRLAALVGPLALGLVTLRSRASPRAAHLLDVAMVGLAMVNVALVLLAIDGRVSLAP